MLAPIKMQISIKGKDEFEATIKYVTKDYNFLTFTEDNLEENFRLELLGNSSFAF